MKNQKKLKRSAPSHVDEGHLDAYRALKMSQFVPFFQPIVALRTGHLAGFEVLARWQHPEAGIISPNKFIEIAEQDAWIHLLTRQILEKAFAAASAFPNHLKLSVNISPIQLEDSELPRQLLEISETARFSLSRLIVEITESALINNVETAGAIVNQLKAMGCQLSLDDFGTGYSSLHHLQSFPFAELKVDRSFVNSMIIKRESRMIVSAVVGLGQSLGLTTVAEGIETQEQAEMMLWLGCELGQGYFYGRPIPAADLAALGLAQRTKLATHTLNPWKSRSASNLTISPSQRLAQLQAVYDGAPVGLAFIDPNLQYVNLNKRLADMNGVPVENHLGCTLSEMIPDLFPDVEPYVRRALNGEAISDIEVRVAASGETRLTSYQPALDETGEVVGASVAVVDITDRKRVDEALTQSEAHYRRMVELNPHVLWIMDPQGRNLDVSPRWDRATGIMSSPGITHDWLTFIHPDDIQATVRAIADSRQKGTSINVEYRVASEPHRWQWKRSIGLPRFDSNGNIVCWCGSVQDIDAPSTIEHNRSQSASHRSDTLKQDRFTALPLGSAEKVKRQQALIELEILDTPAEAEFDDLVFLTAELCAAPISLFSLLETERQWFKASVGLAESESPISSSFCVLAVEQQGLFVVEDATKDERFEHNPFVIGNPHIRFYAGIPLYGGCGVGVGTLCVIDTVARSLSPTQAKALKILSQQIQARLELRLARKQLRKALANDLLPHNPECSLLAASDLFSDSEAIDPRVPFATSICLKPAVEPYV